MSLCRGSRGANLCSLRFHRLQGWSPAAPPAHLQPYRWLGRAKNKVIGATPFLKKSSCLDRSLSSRRKPSEPPTWVGSRGRDARAARSGLKGSPRLRCRSRLAPAARGLARGAGKAGVAGGRSGAQQGHVVGAGSYWESVEPGLAGSREVAERRYWLISTLPGRDGGEGPGAPRLRGCENARSNFDLPTCWESAVLGFPPCGLGLKVGLGRACDAGASGASVVCGSLAAAFALLLWLAGQVTPELRKEPCLAQEELRLASCGLSYHSSASREGTEGE